MCQTPVENSILTKSKSEAYLAERKSPSHLVLAPLTVTMHLLPWPLAGPLNLTSLTSHSVAEQLNSKLAGQAAGG